MFGRSLLTIFIVLLTISVSAQSNHYKNKFYEWDDWEDFDFNFRFDRPFMEFNYGFGTPKHENFTADFAEVGLIELKLGYLRENSYSYGFLDDRRESFFFGSKITPDLKSSDVSPLDFDGTIWRFGFAARKTLGYYGEHVSVLPYHQEGFTWSRLEVPDSKFPSIPLNQIDEILSPTAAQDYRIVQRYEDAFRFGTVVEGGIRLEFAEFVSLNAGYEAAVIFPRHLFWKHAGSFIIEKAGQGALTYFINEVVDATPEAGPIVRFFLLNAYSYAFHLLKQENMNWPFDTETPLTYETFKVGVTFTF